MKRREFLAKLLGGAVGAAVAATVDVDKFLWTPGAKTFFLPPPPQIVDPESGIGIRFLRHFDVDRLQFVSRLDVLYGVGYIRPELACRIVDDVPLLSEDLRVLGERDDEDAAPFLEFARQEFSIKMPVEYAKRCAVIVG